MSCSNHAFLQVTLDAIGSTKKLVCCKSAFLNAFVEEGLKFSSSLYLLLIWMRVLKFVFENPIEVSKNMVNVPFSLTTFKKRRLVRITLTAL